MAEAATSNPAAPELLKRTDDSFYVTDAANVIHELDMHGVSSPKPPETAATMSYESLSAMKRAALTPVLPASPVPRRFWLSRLRHQIYQILSDTNSISGILVSSVLFLAILLSIASYCAASMVEFRIRREEQLYGETESIMDSIELACVVIFTSEYLMRFLTATAVPDAAEFKMLVEFNKAKRALQSTGARVQPQDSRLPRLPQTYLEPWAAVSLKRWLRQQLAFLFAPLNIVDVVAILPFYIPQGGDSGDTSSGLLILRVLRLSRILRLLRLSNRNTGYQLLVRTMRRSVDALGVLLYLVALIVILFGSIIFFCEAGDYDPVTKQYLRPNLTGTDVEVSPFRSIPVAFWFVIVTITTLGYGDLYPTTTAGRILGGLAALCGVVVIALPITILGNSFSEEFSSMKSAKLGEAAKRRRAAERAAAEAKASAQAPAKAPYIRELLATAAGNTAAQSAWPSAPVNDVRNAPRASAQTPAASAAAPPQVQVSSSGAGALPAAPVSQRTGAAAGTAACSCSTDIQALNREIAWIRAALQVLLDAQGVADAVMVRTASGGFLSPSAAESVTTEDMEADAEALDDSAVSAQEGINGGLVVRAPR